MAKVAVTKTDNEYRFMKEKLNARKAPVDTDNLTPAISDLTLWTMTMTRDLRSDSLVYVTAQKSAIKSEKILIKGTVQVRGWAEDGVCKLPLSVTFKVKDQEISVTGAIIRDKNGKKVSKITSNFEGFVYPKANGANVVFVVTQNKSYDPTPKPEVM